MNISSTHNPLTHLSIIVVSIFISSLILSCDNQDCITNSDCPAGKQCKRGFCLANKPDDNVDNYFSTDRNSDELSSDSQTERDSTGGDSLTDDTDDERDTICRPTQANGETCTSDCECGSNHCNSGICCKESECCLTVADCENDLCANVGCRGDKYCVYGASAYPCGSRDQEGSLTCTGANACNGLGACLPVQVDCGVYAENVTGVYTCGETGVSAPCYTSCSAENQSQNCAPGAVCLNGECVVTTAFANGSPCDLGTECASQHCDHGICCSGETTCCNTADDCTDECRTSSCSDFSCTATVYQYCGAADTTGVETCDGENRCDGSGHCRAVTDACSANGFAGDDTYSCTGGASVVAGCFTSCTYPLHCADGFSCDASGVCVADSAEENGAPCADESECDSGHCQNGFCCQSGQCCASSTDCAGDLCGEAACVDFQCTMGNYDSCGAADTSGNTICSDNLRCDGAGGCFPLTPCDGGPYRTIPGQFDCAPGERVSEACRTSCGSDGECNPGYVCNVDAHTCVEIDYAQNGEACEMDADCKSEHCNNGTCCAEGECCKDADDCRVGRCVYEVCTNGGLCNASRMVPCGLPDDGGTYRNCTGGALCDGMGGCDTSVAHCEGAYKWSGGYTCSAGSVAEACFTSCASDQACNPGYGCITGQCVQKRDNGDGPCNANAACLSNNCNKETAVCCEKGMCCLDSGDCGGAACDPVTNACDISCDGGGGDDDTLCTVYGDYHCDGGACVPNLIDGEYPCDEAGDCRSGYCDTDTLGICCANDAASCCNSDSQCSDGFACIDSQCVDDCSPSGTTDSDRCASGFHCVGDRCESDLSNGTIGCMTDDDCLADGKCVNDVCCSNEEGDCCRSSATCDDGNPCTDDVCLPSYHCANLPSGAGASCDIDGTFCNGVSSCDGNGNCIVGTPPCQEEGLCRTGTCNEETDACEAGAANPSAVGSACSAALFCLNGRTKICNAFGACVDPEPSSGVPCATVADTECARTVCNEEADRCSMAPVPDGTACNAANACTGRSTCQDGICVPGMDPPCEDGDPCTTDPCTVVDGQPVCGTHDVIVEAACNDSFHCFGENPTCHDGRCIATENVCADDMGICTMETCREQYYEKTDCAPPERNELTVLNAGTSENLDGIKVFVTREYYQYNDDLCPGDYPGMEAAIAVSRPSNGSFTLTVSNVVPDMDIALLALGDWCNPNTCEHSAINSLTVTGIAGMNVVVLEAMAELPPISFDLTVTDNR